MKKVYFLMLLAAGFLIAPSFAASTAAPSPATDNIEETVKAAKEKWDDMSNKEKRQLRKEMKHKIKTAVKDRKSGAIGSDDKLLLIIIAILLPPLAMLIYEDGATGRFWISVLLWLLFYIPGLIYTLVIILGDK